MRTKILPFFCSLLQTIPLVTAHYGFPVLILNGVATKRWEYIRPTTSFDPNYDYSGPNGMCGFNATLPLFPVKTLTIAAGTSITFGLSRQEYENDKDESKDTGDWKIKPYGYFQHDGPATAYLSKTSGDLNTYAGDGDWFKVAAIGASDGMLWDYRGGNKGDRITFTIPPTTPPGKYLMRAEHLNIATYRGATQMYVNCAHLEITGPGGGTPGPMTKFPGAFSETDSPGIWLPNAMNFPPRPLDELKNWQGAGPTVWKG